MNVKPVLGKITVRTGVAGQMKYSVPVTYPNEPTDVVTFVGSAFGGPVVMILTNGFQTFVDSPSRFGKFGKEWVRKFFS